ncbi:hypothetical protein, partial [Mycoplasmopsis arginini]|uniref:hypothetical protein n=1 Tax=Mycoplasmopsis arginini TaxID=2094 RepID=UPI0027350DE3
IKLYVPSDKNEQIKISKFIELFEKKIDTCKLKLETLKKYKKGLAKVAIKDTINYWKNGIGNASDLSNYLKEINEYS